MESLMEKKIDNLMTHSGVAGVCVSDANGLLLSARGSLKQEMAPLGLQLLTLCSQLEPTNPVSPEVILMGDHGKVTFGKHEDVILAVHQNN